MKINTLLAGVAMLALAAPAHADIISFDAYSASASGHAGVGNSGTDAQGSKWLWSASAWGVPGLGKGDATFETKTGYVATDFTVSFSFFKNNSILQTASTVFESEFDGKWYKWIPTYDGKKSVTFDAPAGVFLDNGGQYFVDIAFAKPGLNGANTGFSAAFSAIVPEISTWGMMLAGFGALAFAGYRRRPVAA